MSEYSHYNNFANICKNEEIFSDFKNDQDLILQNSQQKTTNNNLKGNILSERKFFSMEPKYENEEKAYCEICYEELIKGEIVYYCLCAKFYHPNCLISTLAKQKLNINKNCEECKNPFKVCTYEINMTCGVERSCSTIDTNINNLENYNDMCGIAFHLTHEGLADIINKKNDNISINLSEDIGRIALSPITFNHTPYSGKTKQQISSNQKAEEYFRLQSKYIIY